MKKVYEAPTLEVELYELDASIAAGCATIIPALEWACSQSDWEEFFKNVLQQTLPPGTLFSGPFCKIQITDEEKVAEYFETTLHAALPLLHS